MELQMSKSTTITYDECMGVPVAHIDGKRFTLGELWQTLDQNNGSSAHLEAYQNLSPKAGQKLTAA